jgi:outer membrane lipoprotein-sorting protein
MLMSPKAKPVLSQLKAISRVEPRSEAVANALANARAKLATLAGEEPPRPPSRNSVIRQTSRSSLRRAVQWGLVISLLVAATLGFVLSLAPGNAAFARMLEKLEHTQSLSFTGRIHGPHKLEDEEAHVIVLSDGRIRADSPRGYSIQDSKAHKMIMVDKTAKTVQIMEGFSPFGQAPADLNVYEKLKNIRKEAASRLPDEVLGGKKVLVFRVEVKDLPSLSKPFHWKAWIDPQTELPLQLQLQEQDESGKPIQEVMEDIRFDQALDPALFDFKPPEGYTVSNHGTTSFPNLPAGRELQAPVLHPGLGLGPIRFGMSREQIESLIGKPDSYESDQTSLLYYSRGFTLSVSHRSGLKGIHCLSHELEMHRLRVFAGKTKEGIGIGSTLHDVEKVFGKPDRNESYAPGNQYLEFYRIGLSIRSYEDKVIEIDMTAGQTRPGDAENVPAKSPEKKSAAAGDRSLRLIVLEPDGKPAAGAKIHAGIWYGDRTKKKNEDYVIDAQGRAVVTLPQKFDIFRLLVRSRACVPLFVHWEELDENPPEEYTIRLTKGTTVGGFIKNAQGQPIVGAKIEVAAYPRNHREEVGKRVQPSHWLTDFGDAPVTDAAGRWTIDNVPEGDVDVFVKISHPDYVGDKEPGDLQKTQHVALEAFRAQKATLILARKK